MSQHEQIFLLYVNVMLRAEDGKKRAGYRFASPQKDKLPGECSNAVVDFASCIRLPLPSLSHKHIPTLEKKTLVPLRHVSECTPW